MALADRRSDSHKRLSALRPEGVAGSPLVRPWCSSVEGECVQLVSTVEAFQLDLAPFEEGDVRGTVRH